MRTAKIGKITPENWQVWFLLDGVTKDSSWGFPNFEMAAEAAKAWILNETIG